MTRGYLTEDKESDYDMRCYSFTDCEDKKGCDGYDATCFYYVANRTMEPLSDDASLAVDRIKQGVRLDKEGALELKTALSKEDVHGLLKIVVEK